MRGNHCCFCLVVNSFHLTRKWILENQVLHNRACAVFSLVLCFLIVRGECIALMYLSSSVCTKCPCSSEMFLTVTGIFSKFHSWSSLSLRWPHSRLHLVKYYPYHDSYLLKPKKSEIHVIFSSLLLPYFFLKINAENNCKCNDKIYMIKFYS